MTFTLTFFLFLCGLAGFILNRNNVILLIVAIELLLLAVLTVAKGAYIFNFILFLNRLLRYINYIFITTILYFKQ